MTTIGQHGSNEKLATNHRFPMFLVSKKINVSLKPQNAAEQNCHELSNRGKKNHQSKPIGLSIQPIPLPTFRS